MPTTDADRAQQPLGRTESLQLLATTGIGRLAYSQAALPAIRPVSFCLRGDELFIPVPDSGPLTDALRGSVVAFEADAYDESTRTGWTVAVVGTSQVLDGRCDDVPAHSVAAIRVGLVQGLRTEPLT